jgi:hypothetical protein
MYTLSFTVLCLWRHQNANRVNDCLLITDKQRRWFTEPMNISLITESVPSGLEAGQSAAGSHVSHAELLNFAVERGTWFVTVHS